METGEKKYANAVDYDDYLIERLRNDPDYAAGYLATCFEETGETPELFLLALSDVLKAYSDEDKEKGSGDYTEERKEL